MERTGFFFSPSKKKKAADDKWRWGCGECCFLECLLLHPGVGAIIHKEMAQTSVKSNCSEIAIRRGIKVFVVFIPELESVPSR